MNVVNRTRLTPRETQVLRLISLGGRNAEIAGELGISEETVKSHVKHVLRALGASSRAHAVAIGIRRGVIS